MLKTLSDLRIAICPVKKRKRTAQHRTMRGRTTVAVFPGVPYNTSEVMTKRTSSFLLDQLDSSVTQSAMEDAYLSGFNNSKT